MKVFQYYNEFLFQFQSDFTICLYFFVPILVMSLQIVFTIERYLAICHPFTHHSYKMSSIRHSTLPACLLPPLITGISVFLVEDYFTIITSFIFISIITTSVLFWLMRSAIRKMVSSFTTLSLVLLLFSTFTHSKRDDKESWQINHKKLSSRDKKKTSEWLRHCS